MRTKLLALALLGGIAFAQNSQAPNPPQPPAQQQQAPTEISADLGSCSVLFHVTDLAGHPLYNAQVHILIRYGFLNKRKTELTAGTNADGKVKFVRLPNEAKHGLHFDISYGDQRATIIMNPGTWCQASYDVPLKVSK